MLRRFFVNARLLLHRRTRSERARDKRGTPSPDGRGLHIHVLAPHLVDGKQMGPYHHYCKVVAPDPQIVCLIFESTEPNAMLMQVEYIWAKSLTASQRSAQDLEQVLARSYRRDRRRRVKVLDLPDDKAKEVADIVSKTDGYIIHIPFKGNLPEAGKVSFAQAVGHKPLTAAEYKKSAEEAAKK